MKNQGLQCIAQVLPLPVNLELIANITVTFTRDTCKWFSDSMLLFYQESHVENKIIHQYVGLSISLKKKSILLLFQTTFPACHALKDNI